MQYQLVKIQGENASVPGAPKEEWVMSAVPSREDIADFGHPLAARAMLPGKFYTSRMARFIAGLFPEDAEWTSYWSNLESTIVDNQAKDRASHNLPGYTRPKFITGTPASVAEINALLFGNAGEETAHETDGSDTGCIVLPAFQPWGCQQEAKVASGELALPAKEPSEEQAEGLVPDTMPGIWKLLGFKANSLYDLGIHTLSPAGKKPSLIASLKAYRKNMLLTVGRALLLREYGKEFSSEQVRKAVIASWKSNSRMKKYSEVLRANLGEEVEKRVMEILGEIPGFMEGKIASKAKYMDTFKGEPWSIKSFVLMCKVTGQVDLKKTGWRVTKKS